KQTGPRSVRASSRLSSQHPTADKPRHVLAGPHNPDRPYHGALSMSPDCCIKTPMGSPLVGCQWYGLLGARGFEQHMSQPWRVASLKVERLAKYPSATRMRRTQTIILEFANSNSARQPPCHAGTPTSHHE